MQKYVITLDNKQKFVCFILSVFLILVIIVLRKWELSPFVFVWLVFASTTCASQCIISKNEVKVRSIETFWIVKSFKTSELAGAKMNSNLRIGSITIYTTTGNKYVIPSAYPIKDYEYINHLTDLDKKTAKLGL